MYCIATVTLWSSVFLLENVMLSSFMLTLWCITINFERLTKHQECFNIRDWYINTGLNRTLFAWTWTFHKRTDHRHFNTIWMEFSVIPGEFKWNGVQVQSFWKKGITFRGIPFFSLLQEFPEISVQFVHTFSAWRIRASCVLQSYTEGKHCGCWLLVLLTKSGCCSSHKSYRKFHSNGKRSYESIFMFINQGQEKNNGNSPNISLLSG